MVRCCSPGQAKASISSSRTCEPFRASRPMARLWRRDSFAMTFSRKPLWSMLPSRTNRVTAGITLGSFGFFCLFDIYCELTGRITSRIDTWQQPFVYFHHQTITVKLYSPTSTDSRQPRCFKKSCSIVSLQDIRNASFDRSELVRFT